MTLVDFNVGMQLPLFGDGAGLAGPTSVWRADGGDQSCDSTGNWQSAPRCDAGSCDAGLVCPEDAGE